MNFTQLFLKYNYSLNPLHGSVIQCLIKKLQQNMVLVDTRLKTCNNLFPTWAEESANHQASEVYFGNWRCVNVYGTKDVFCQNH